MLRELTNEDLDFGELIDLDEFIMKVVDGEIDNSDGYGRLVYNSHEVEDSKEVAPSEVAFDMTIDEDVTGILWFQTY